jgi:hypothetical protein
MASQGYMGPSEFQSLIAGWVDIVGKHNHHDDDDDDDRKRKKKHDRDHEGRGEYRGDQAWWRQPPPWWQGSYKQWQQLSADQQQQWWRQTQQQQPSWWQQPPPWWQQPTRPDDRIPISPQQQPYPQAPGYQWVPGSGGTPGHWVRPTVRDHRAGRGAQGGVTVTPGARSPFGPFFGSPVAGQWVDIVGQGMPGGDFIPPRNALVELAGPDRAGREVLPMSTGVAILPTQSAQITARPQRVAFRPERVFISAAGTSGGAADWVVNDIKIGNRSQFSQSGDVPGDMFATNAIDGFVSFETAQTAMDVVMVVTYIGLNESGVPFFASIVGTAAI